MHSPLRGLERYRECFWAPTNDVFAVLLLHCWPVSANDVGLDIFKKIFFFPAELFSFHPCFECWALTSGFTAPLVHLTSMQPPSRETLWHTADHGYKWAIPLVALLKLCLFSWRFVGFLRMKRRYRILLQVKKLGKALKDKKANYSENQRKKMKSVSTAFGINIHCPIGFVMIELCFVTLTRDGRAVTWQLTVRQNVLNVWKISFQTVEHCTALIEKDDAARNELGLKILTLQELRRIRKIRESVKPETIWLPRQPGDKREDNSRVYLGEDDDKDSSHEKRSFSRFSGKR